MLHRGPLLHQGRRTVAGADSVADHTVAVADIAVEVARRVGYCCIGFGDLRLGHGHCFSPAVGMS